MLRSRYKMLRYLTVYSVDSSLRQRSRNGDAIVENIIDKVKY